MPNLRIRGCSCYDYTDSALTLVASFAQCMRILRIMTGFGAGVSKRIEFSNRDQDLTDFANLQVMIVTSQDSGKIESKGSQSRTDCLILVSRFVWACTS